MRSSSCAYAHQLCTCQDFNLLLTQDATIANSNHKFHEQFTCTCLEFFSSASRHQPNTSVVLRCSPLQHSTTRCLQEGPHPLSLHVLVTSQPPKMTVMNQPTCRRILMNSQVHLCLEACVAQILVLVSCCKLALRQLRPDSSRPTCHAQSASCQLDKQLYESPAQCRGLYSSSTLLTASRDVFLQKVRSQSGSGAVTRLNHPDCTSCFTQAPHQGRRICPDTLVRTARS